MESVVNTTANPNEQDSVYREGENANPNGQERTVKEATDNERNLHCDSCGREKNEKKEGSCVDHPPPNKAQQV